MTIFELITFLFLVFAVSFVSYRTLRALRRSNSAGLFRSFVSIPLVYFVLTIAAAPAAGALVIIRLFRGSNGVGIDESGASFIGNRESRVYHRAGCEYHQMMAPGKRVVLDSVEDARGKGYRPCSTCRPGL